MGYACPVCGDPQADAEHLANHLAFTAMLGDDAHEDWLAEYAPDWDESDADRLASVVSEHAEEMEYPQVFEDTTDEGHDHSHDDERSGALFEDDGITADAARERAREGRTSDLDGEAADIMQEARQLTERMHDDTADEGREADDSEAAASDEAETE